MDRFRNRLCHRLSVLTRREREVLALRYGTKAPSLSYEEIAARVGLSPLEVRRLERRALKRLRRWPLEGFVWDEA